MSEQNAGREDNNWRPKATGKGVPRLTIDAAVGIVDYAHITPQEGEVIMGQSGNSRHGGLQSTPLAAIITAIVCTVSMIAGSLITTSPAWAEQDGDARIEIDNDKSVGQWNISQEGQTVNIAVGQAVSLHLWNFNGTGIEAKFNTVSWYINGKYIELCDSYDDNGNCKTNNNRDIDTGDALAIDMSNRFVGLREGAATVKAIAHSGGEVETATAHFVVHKPKLKIVRTQDSKVLAPSDVTELTGGEDTKLNYYVTFDGDGTTAQNKRYSYEFTTSLWNNQRSYSETVTGSDGKTTKITHTAPGWTVSNPNAIDFNGNWDQKNTNVLIRTLTAGDSKVSLGCFFIMNRKIASESHGKTSYSTVQQLYGSINSSTNIRVISPTISVDYGATSSPVVVDEDGIVDLSVGEILQLNYDISPLHTDYATEHRAHWDSSNKQVATIDSDSSRRLTAIDTGTTTVTVATGGMTFPFNVTVSEPKLSLTYQGKLPEPHDVTGKVMELTVGETSKLTLAFAQRHDYASLNTMTWKSSNTSVATVTGTSSVTNSENSPSTTVSAKQPGTVMITGKLAGRTVTATVRVVAAKLNILRDHGLSTLTSDDNGKTYVTNGNLEATSGERFRLYTEVSPLHDYASLSNSAGNTRWSEDSHGKIITLPASGSSINVDALSTNGGKSALATITAKVGNQKATVKITVVRPQLSITNKVDNKDNNVTGQTLSLERNQQIRLNSLISNRHTDYAQLRSNIVEWASANPAIASVASKTSGTVTGKSEGNTAISVTSDGAVAKVNIVVKAAIKSIATLPDVTTYAYNPPALPVTAKITWDNGKVTDEKIVWDTVPAASYQRTGSFTVRGKVGSRSVSVRVVVKHRYTFADVTSSTPHSSDIIWLADVNITTGWDEGRGRRTFRGMDTVKRQDMAAFLRREAIRRGVPGAATWTPTQSDWNRFRDVNRNTPHAEDILWLAQTGITKGYLDGTFRGGDPVYRQDMAAFLRRLARNMQVRGAATWVPMRSDWNRFRDVTPTSPHAQDVLWLASQQVTTGYPDGTFGGMIPVYRQDMAAFIHRLDNLG